MIFYSRLNLFSMNNTLQSTKNLSIDITPSIQSSINSQISSYQHKKAKDSLDITPSIQSTSETQSIFQKPQKQKESHESNRFIISFKLDFSFDNPIEESINYLENSNLEDSSEIYKCYIKELNYRREKFNLVENEVINVESNLSSFKSECEELEFDKPYQETKFIGITRIPLKQIQDYYEISQAEQNKTSLKQEINVILQNAKDLQNKQPLQIQLEPHYKMDDFNISIHLRQKVQISRFKENFSKNIRASQASKENHQTSNIQTKVSDRCQEWLKKCKERQSKQKQQLDAKSTEGCTFVPLTNRTRRGKSHNGLLPNYQFQQEQ